MKKQATLFLMVILVSLAVWLGQAIYAASSTDELGGETGKYTASQSSPDSLTTTKSGATLIVTDGSASPDNTADSGNVQLTGKSGATATFSGRTTGWGCTYTVNGVYAGTGTGTSTWTNIFEENSEPRILLEVNDAGAGDNVVLIAKTGTLYIDIKDVTGGPYTVTLSGQTANVLSFDSTVSVSPGTRASVNLTGGTTGGNVTITASAAIGGNNISKTIDVKVLAFKGKVEPTEVFSGRSYSKLGVGETGQVTTECAEGTTFDDLKPLTWNSDSSTIFGLSNPVTDNGTADFLAGNEYGSASLTLSDKNGNTITYPVTVIIPTGLKMVNARELQSPKYWHINNTASSGYLGEANLLPDDVCFDAIEVQESGGSYVGTGIFSGHTATHPTGPWRTVTSLGTLRNYITGFQDKIYEWNLTQGSGTFQWPANWWYKINNNTYFMCKVMQSGNSTSTGTLTVSKGGYSATKNWSDATALISGFPTTLP